MNRKRWRSSRSNPTFLLLSIFLCTLSGGVVHSQEERGELYNRVFGAPPAEESVELTVGINDFPAGQIRGITDFISLRIDGQQLIQLVAPVLTEEASRDLTAMIPAAFIEPEKGEVLGITLFPDLNRLHLDVSIPPEIMDAQPFRERTTSLRSPGEEPAQVSGYVNVEASAYMQEGRDLLTGTVTPSLWMRGFVAQGEVSLFRPLDGDYRSGEDVATLQAYRLFRDVPSRQMRLSLGTVQPVMPGPFATVDIVGFDVDRTITMDPEDRLLAQREFRFTADDPGVYRVSVNDRLVANRRVPTGSYVIEDLRLQHGLNRVTVQPGRSELVPWSPRLVSQGKHVFRISAGVYRPDLERPAATGYWLWGVHPQVTVGAIGQVDDDNGAFGVNGRFATAAGTTEATVAGSRADVSGLALSADHALSLPLFPRAPSLSFGGELYGEGYRFLDDEGDLPPSRPQRVLYGTVGYEIEEGPRFSLSARWRTPYDGSERTSAVLSVHQGIGRAGSLSARIGPEWQDGTIRGAGQFSCDLPPGRGMSLRRLPTTSPTVLLRYLSIRSPDRV